MRLVLALLRGVLRLGLLPFKLLIGAVFASFRTGLRVGSLPVRAGRRATRLAGVKGVACFVLGVAVGLLFAPGPGRDLRACIQRRLRGQGLVSDEELAEQVRFELGHAPRTWHLAQPEVGVAEARVQLQGAVPDEAARLELVRVAAAVPGVVGVDDLLSADDLPDADGTGG